MAKPSDPSSKRGDPRRTRRSFAIGLGSVCAALLLPASAQAAPPALIGKPKGRPRIVIDRTTLPPGTPDAAATLRHLKFKLKKEARRADWGAGANSTIALRFTVDALVLEPRGEVLKIRCSALGELPRRRTARSQLTYSGARAEGQQLVLHVLDIVVRGVITRLADLERSRRGA
jgi:hypothetical protein